jgi:hypothetical protein
LSILVGGDVYIILTATDQLSILVGGDVYIISRVRNFSRLEIFQKRSIVMAWRAAAGDRALYEFFCVEIYDSVSILSSWGKMRK